MARKRKRRRAMAPRRRQGSGGFDSVAQRKAVMAILISTGIVMGAGAVKRAYRSVRKHGGIRNALKVRAHSKARKHVNFMKDPLSKHGYE